MGKKVRQKTLFFLFPASPNHTGEQAENLNQCFNLGVSFIFFLPAQIGALRSCFTVTI